MCKFGWRRCVPSVGAYSFSTVQPFWYNLVKPPTNLVSLNGRGQFAYRETGAAAVACGGPVKTLNDPSRPRRAWLVRIQGIGRQTAAHRALPWRHKYSRPLILTQTQGYQTIMNRSCRFGTDLMGAAPCCRRGGRSALWRWDAVGVIYASASSLPWGVAVDDAMPTRGEDDRCRNLEKQTRPHYVLNLPFASPCSRMTTCAGSKGNQVQLPSVRVSR